MAGGLGAFATPLLQKRYHFQPLIKIENWPRSRKGASIYDVHSNFGIFDPLSAKSILIVLNCAAFLDPPLPSVRTLYMEAP